MQRRISLHVLILLGLAFSLSACYTVRTSFGPTCQADVNEEDGFWKDKKYTDIVVKLKPGQSPLVNIPCPAQCVCAVEYKVGFGQVIVSTITLGFVRRVKLRYSCCQQ